MNEGTGLSFEEALVRLETVVEQLESGDLTLEESLRCFEEGVALQRRCIADLSAAQGKIEQLLDETTPASVGAGSGGGNGTRHPAPGDGTAGTAAAGRATATESLF